MGATTWQYFVPYQQDVGKVLQELREEVFRAGAYRPPRERDPSRARKPESIQQLVRRAREQGTHSIIDIEKASVSPEPSAVCPLPDEAIEQIFGTSTPSRQAIEVAAAHGDFEDYGRRGRGIYLPAFEDGAPTKLFFWGYSGD